MANNHEDALDTIVRLREDVKHKNNDIYLAAKFGKELLEKNEKLTMQLTEIRVENEVIKQKNYSLQFDLEAKIQTVNTQASELEFQQKQYDKLVGKFDILQKESIKQKQRINNLEKEKVDFEKVQEDSQREICTLKKKIDLLEQQIQGFHLKAETSINLDVIEDLNEENDINYYKEKNKQFQDVISNLQCELESTKLSENRLNNLVKEFEIEICDRDKEIAGYSVEVQKAKDFATELQGEIEILKLDQVDVNRRGNSVFGELDDRRQLVEKEYKLICKKYEHLKIEYINMKKELGHCKAHMAILLSMTSRNYQDVYINELEDDLSSAKREIENLNTQLTKTTKNLQETRTQKTETYITGTNEYEYLRILNQQSQKKIKELENELITARLKNMRDNDDLVQTRQQNYNLQLKLDAEELETMKLQQKIKELTHLSDSAPPVNESKFEFPGCNPDSLKNLETIGKIDDKMGIVSGEAVLNKNGIHCLKRGQQPASRDFLSTSEHIQMKMLTKSADKENNEVSAKQESAKHSLTECHQRFRTPKTKKPLECSQQ